MAAAGRFRHPDGSEAAALPDQYELARYFHTDLSASQRWPFNSLISASIAPPSSSGSAPSSSAVPASSDRLSFGPAPSSAVVVTGLDTHSISLSAAPGFSGETSAETS